MILDDTYNSSPAALSNALNILKDVQKMKRKIAVLGDMLELGKHSSDEHYEAGKLAAQSADILITVGIRARRIAEGALDAEMDESNIFQMDDSKSAGVFLKEIVKEKDCILVKGSQSIRMEKVVFEIMADPEKANEFLVRQEDEWKTK